MMFCHHSTAIKQWKLKDYNNIIVQLVRALIVGWMWCFCDDFTKDIDSK